MTIYKLNETLCLLRKLTKILAMQSFLRNHKAFIRPHLDYAGVIFDQSYKNSFHQKLESFSYNAASAITGVIRGPSKEMLFHIYFMFIFFSKTRKQYIN